MNLVTFGTAPDALAAFHQMLEDLRLDGAPLGTIDFNKLVPMPESLNIEESERTSKGLNLYQCCRFSNPEYQEEYPELWALGKQASENLERYGSATWYDWCIENWGTKWNAYGCELSGEKDSVLVFLTAWGCVPGLMKILSERCPEQKLLYRWADVDIRWDLGEIVYQGGRELKSRIPQSGSKEARRMAKEFLSGKLFDLDLLLTPESPQNSRKPKMELLGQNGNIFEILAQASGLLKNAGMEEQSEEMYSRVTSCGDYDEVLRIISEYVETELSVPAEPKKTTKKRGKSAYER